MFLCRMEWGSCGILARHFFSSQKIEAHSAGSSHNKPLCLLSHSNKSKAAHDPPTYTLTSFFRWFHIWAWCGTAVSNFFGDVVLSTCVFWQMVHAPLHPWSGDSVSLYECAVAIFIAIFSQIRLLTSLLLFSIDRSPLFDNTLPPIINECTSIILYTICVVHSYYAVLRNGVAVV